MAPDDERDEIVRLRDRLHKVEATMAAMLLGLHAVEEKLTPLVDRVNALARADEIAEAVAAKVQDSNRLKLSLWQTIGAVLVGVAAIADFARGWVVG